MNEFTYILAPNTPHNYTVLGQAIAEFPDLVENRQVKSIPPKSAGDVVDADGVLLVAESVESFIWMKARTAEIDQQLLDQVTDAQLFYYPDLPYNDYWI